MTDPFKVDGPTIISTSGGRTSGYMLWRVLQANGGKLPPDCYAVFCNTGLEHPNTLTFVHQIEERWCPVTWLEYRRIEVNAAKDMSADALDAGAAAEYKHSFAVVDYCHASRKGEPFEALIEAKNMLPNPRTRFCTSELKVRSKTRWARSIGWDHWDNFIGLRADEMRRVINLTPDTKAETIKHPLAMGVVKMDVLAFWDSQPFNLNLPDDRYGNCVGCFLKGRRKLAAVARDTPEYLEWWARQEEETRQRTTKYNGERWNFRNDRPTYRQMLTQVSVQGRLLGDIGLDDETIPCMCSD